MYIGLDNTAAAGIELCSSSMQYIDFTIPSSDYQVRMIFNNTDSSFNCFVGGSATTHMTLSTTALYVGGTTVSSSDKRLKFNEKPLANALYAIHQLELVEYDQSQHLPETYTADTPQSHQGGFIA